MFLAWSALFKHHFNTALVSAAKHLIPSMSKKNIYLKSQLIHICIAVVKIVPIFLKKKKKHSFFEYPRISCPSKTRTYFHR